MQISQLTWMDFFSKFTQKIQTIHQIFLSQKWPDEIGSNWKPAFELFQQVLKKASFDPYTLGNRYLSYSEKMNQLLNDFNSNQEKDSAPHDKRFTAQAWKTHPFYRWIHQHYLTLCQEVEEQISCLSELDHETEQQLRFYIKQFLDAISPGHFVATNPDVLEMTLKTQGQNIIQGLDRFIEDMQQNEGSFKINMTDLTAFKVGENIATTAGQVIYQNDLMQLIQYEPQTKKVYQKPLLIIPPWINKYYILDLNNKQSLSSWLVKQGYTVFMISWVNPNASHADKDFEDYLLEGPISALNAIEQATGEQEVNAVGYCIGGTLLACALSYLSHQKQKHLVSGTYLTTLLDFSKPGDLGIFINEKQLNSLEAEIEKKGFLSGQILQNLFSNLRANDLIWSYYIKHYLQGNQPTPMEVLFWNSDPSNLPAAMYRFYIRNMYQHNRLAKGALQLAGIPIDIRNIKVPVYFLSTEQDHIAPWKSTYEGMNLHTGSSIFVLAGSGHVAGIINAPIQTKYHYYTPIRKVKKADFFIKNAKRNEGSWWNHWEKWLRKHSGTRVPARKPGEGHLKTIEPAPGSYVKMKIAA